MHALLRLWSNFLACALSFAVIGVMWQSHHAVFRLVHTINRTTVCLNLVLPPILCLLANSASESTLIIAMSGLLLDNRALRRDLPAAVIGSRLSVCLHAHVDMIVAPPVFGGEILSMARTEDKIDVD